MSLRGIVPPDPETGVSQERFAVIFTPRQNRKRFPAGCVEIFASVEAALSRWTGDALATARRRKRRTNPLTCSGCSRRLQAAQEVEVGGLFPAAPAECLILNPALRVDQVG